MTFALKKSRALVLLVGFLVLIASKAWSQSAFGVFAPFPPDGFPDTGSKIPFQGNVAGTAPGLSSFRYQQVYHASLFTNVPPGVPYLSVISFLRDDGQIGQAGWTITNMEIRLSTTLRAPDNLSVAFAENVGPDETVVLGPKRFRMVLEGSGFGIPLDRPFVYDPAAGNLLLDVRVDGIQVEDAVGSSMDASHSTLDRISRLWATNANALVASAMDTDGLVTLFNFYAVPALTIRTNGVPTPEHTLVVVWPSQPSVFRLQRSTNPENPTSWMTITNASPPRYFISQDAITGKRAFFRLVWPEGP